LHPSTDGTASNQFTITGLNIAATVRGLPSAFFSHNVCVQGACWILRNGTCNFAVTVQNDQTFGWVAVVTFPPGQGTTSIRLVVNSQQSAPFSVKYAAPTLSSVTPLLGPTVGGQPLHVSGQRKPFCPLAVLSLFVSGLGTNFGTSSIITVGGRVCSPVGFILVNARSYLIAVVCFAAVLLVD
jgi:hypothetical protein